MADDLAVPHEESRLAAVRRYDILDTPTDGTFEAITALVAMCLRVPVSVISIVDRTGPGSIASRHLGALTLYGDCVAAFRPRPIRPRRSTPTTPPARSTTTPSRRGPTRSSSLWNPTEIGIALGILVERHTITPGQAFDMLRAASQHRYRKLRDIAADLVAPVNSTSTPTAAELTAPDWRGKLARMTPQDERADDFTALAELAEAFSSLVAAVHQAEPPGLTAARLLDLAGRCLPSSQGSDLIVVERGAPHSVASNTPHAEAIHRIRHATGEGPGLDVLDTNDLVLTGDLAQDERWP